MRKPNITRYDVGFWVGIFTAISFRIVDHFLTPHSLLNWIISIIVGTILILAGENLAKEISDN